MKISKALCMAVVLSPFFIGSAPAAQMTASCTRLLSISDGEASYIYFRAEEDLGTATAGRLWSAYHRLRNHCAGHPRSLIEVSVEPRVKAFLEAYR